MHKLQPGHIIPWLIFFHAKAQCVFPVISVFHLLRSNICLFFISTSYNPFLHVNVFFVPSFLDTVVWTELNWTRTSHRLPWNLSKCQNLLTFKAKMSLAINLRFDYTTIRIGLGFQFKEIDCQLTNPERKGQKCLGNALEYHMSSYAYTILHTWDHFCSFCVIHLYFPIKILNILQ